MPVRTVNQKMAGWIDQLGVVWVEGQLTQLSRNSSSYVYLTLRDRIADVSLKAHAPRALIESLPAIPAAGAQLIVQGKPRLWPNRADLSLEIRAIRLAGEGELLARLEQRRQLLAAEGLFAAELKRPLPFLPRSIGLVTAAGSAAERDVLDNVRRRWPGAHFTVRAAAMQGTNSSREVIEALTWLQQQSAVEVIVIARGGGSVEDLLPFSDEALIRHVHSLTTPVVSAIGHEQDSPLLDLVADVRASTPTDAAKLVSPDVAEEAQRIAQARLRAVRAVRHLLDREERDLAALRARPVMADPRAAIDVHRREISELQDRSRREFRRQLTSHESELDLHLARVRALSPVSTLNRGYAIVADASGRALTSAREAGPSDTLQIRLADGRIAAVVSEVQPIDPPEADDE